MFQSHSARCHPHSAEESCESHEGRERAGRWPGFGPWGFGPFGGPFMHQGPFGDPFERQFGGRRPLRFLAHKLDLDEKQFTELARIIEEMKTERAQAAVDDRRTLSDYAEAASGETFDAVKATAGATRRTESVTRVNATLVKSLRQIHAMLNPEQRERFAFLIRSGFLLM